jgi:integrase
VFTPELLAEFLDGVNGDPLYPLLHLAALTGLRRGERIGLPWIDIDRDSRTLTVFTADARSAVAAADVDVDVDVDVEYVRQRPQPGR